MSSPRFEAFLARLYGDEGFAARFIAAPDAVLAASDLDARERRAALDIDRLELQMASRSFAAKRRLHRRSLPTRCLRHLRRMLS